MSKLTFYRQQRQDGGIRTAITVDEATVWHHFQPGAEPPDPALLWYVDIRCEGTRLPVEPEAARRWLLDQAAAIRQALTDLADKLQAGLDTDPFPLEWEVPNPPRRVKMKLVCSATRRQTLLALSRILTDIRDRWEAILDELTLVTTPALT
jgi:hypothetical protein